MNIEDYTREPLTRWQKIRAIVSGALLSFVVVELTWLSILLSRLMQ